MALSGFQSTHPVRGATCEQRAADQTHGISIHAPRAGCDGRTGEIKAVPAKFQSTHPVRGATRIMWMYIRMADFNPRTPCGVRHDLCEADFWILIFQSTHPVRGATYGFKGLYDAELFQSTHPVRGATRSACHILHYTDISIHAPRAGCDISNVLNRLVDRLISIHAPRAGCDHGGGERPAEAVISIHAPRAGCDFVQPLFLPKREISIHAPRAGCDVPD